MKKLVLPSFLPGILIICLIIGLMANVISYMGVAIVILTILLYAATRFVFIPRLNHIPFSRLRIAMGIGFVAMVIAQIMTLIFFPNTVYHDPYRVLSQADQMAANQNTWDITYFWRYPNNVSITYLMSLWLRITQLFGLSTNTAIHLLSIIVLDGFILYFLVVIRRLNQNNSMVLGAFAFFVLTPFAYTYYLQVFYSDLPTMFVLLLVLSILYRWPTYSRRQKIGAGLGLVVTILVGDLIKPNLIVLIPALVIVAVWLGVKKRLGKSQLMIPIILIMLGFGLSVPTTQAIQHTSNYHTNPKFELPATHWMLMAYNAGTQGTYSGTDVINDNAQPNPKARQAYDLQQISKRVKKLGVFGVIKLWLTKVGILLSVSDIQDWYNGGFRAAPAWYQQHAQFFNAMISLIYTTATFVFWLFLITRLTTWRVNLSDQQQVVALIAIVTALGYIAFHTLLWEVEPRYGQAILPLLMFALAALPDRVNRQFLNLRWVTLKRFSAVLIVVILFVTVGLAKVVAAKNPQPLVVAAQRSQLSLQYGAQPYAMAPEETITEAVDLKGAANYFSVQVHDKSDVNVYLKNLKSGEQYQMTDSGDSYRLYRNLTPGHYQIIVRNDTNRPQNIDIVDTTNYHLADYPLVINGHHKPTSSLVYKVMLNVK